jgi:hypothetical protein
MCPMGLRRTRHSKEDYAAGFDKTRQSQCPGQSQQHDGRDRNPGRWRTRNRGIEETEFFKKLRSDLVVSLYNQKDLWPKFGYEGASAEKGGYLHRGFDDISWLPKG